MIETILWLRMVRPMRAPRKDGDGLASRLGARLSGVSVLDERLVRAPNADAALPPFPEADLTAYYRARVEAVARRFGERARGEGLESQRSRRGADDRIVDKVQGLISSSSVGRYPRQRRGASARPWTGPRKTSKPTILVPVGPRSRGRWSSVSTAPDRIAAKLAVTRPTA